MIKIGSFAFFCSVVLCLFSLPLQAETNVSALADRQQLGIGDAFTVVVTVESDEDFEAQLPQMPRVNGLEEINSAVGGRQSSSSMAIVNGKTQFKSQTIQQYQYLMSPQKEGTFIIPVIDIIVNGHTYKTQPIKIEVGEQFRNGVAQKKGVPPNGRPRFPPGFGADEDETNPFGGSQNQAEDLFDQLLQQQQRVFGSRNLPGFGQQPPQQIPNKKLDVNTTRDNFFVYLDVDKTEVYEGEQVTANWYIYTRANIESLDRVKFPDLKGFWKEIIEEVPSLQFTDEIVNGVRYKKALLASHALFPIKAGTAVIDEFKIKAKVRSMSSWGNSSAFDVTKVSKRTPIKVLPLPEDGKTVSFSGAVGQYRVTAKTEGTSFPANQPFSFKIRYEGLGNAKLIDLPQINWPDGLEVYDSKSDAKFFKEGNSYKEFEVLVIPRKEGPLKIPALELTYFDPASKKYVLQSTDEIALQITAGNGQPVPAASAGAAVAASKDTQAAAQPILQLPEAGVSLAPYRLWIYAGLLLVGFLLILIRTLRSLGQLNFESETLRLIQVKQKSVDRFAGSQDWRKVGSEATNLIYLIVAQLAGQKKADQELHLLIKEIPSKDQQKYLDQINSLFDYFQLLGFSPDEIMRNVVKKNLMQQNIQQLKNLSKEIVDKIRKEDKNNS